MRLPRIAVIGVGIVALAVVAWALGSLLDETPLDGLFGLNPYLLAYFAFPAGVTGITVATAGFALQRPLRLRWVWLLVPTIGLAVLTFWLWAYFWHGYCCTA